VVPLELELYGECIYNSITEQLALVKSMASYMYIRIQLYSFDQVDYIICINNLNCKASAIGIGVLTSPEE
jgi:hypothetical protein